MPNAKLASSNWQVSVQWAYDDTSQPPFRYKDDNNMGFSPNFSNGTNAGQAQVAHGMQITLAPTATTVINFATTGGAIGFVDFQTQPLVLTKINGLAVKMTTGISQAASIILGNWTTRPISDIFVTTAAGGFKRVKSSNGGDAWVDDVAGWVITAGTADTLWIKNEDASNTATFILGVVGRIN
jgi:hypothetical protein